MTKKDFTLLRPFDLEAAKSGQKLMWDQPIGDTVYEYVGGPDKDGKLAVLFNGNIHLSDCAKIRMAPLCWFEGKPVYTGDVLYWNGETPEPGSKFTVGHNVTDSGMICGTSVLLSGSVIDTPGTGVYLKNLTWNPPVVKVKREGYAVFRVNPRAIHGAREQAETALKNSDVSVLSDLMAGPFVVGRVEWEEEAKPEAGKPNPSDKKAGPKITIRALGLKLDAIPKGGAHGF